MRVEITVPVLGESISSASVAILLVPNGSFVEAGQDIVELETDKVNQVLTAPATGTVYWVVSVGEEVKIGQSIGSVDTDQAKIALPSLPKEAPTKEKIFSIEETKTLPQRKETRKVMSSLRKTLAKRLVEAKNKTAMLTTFNEVDMTEILHIKEQEGKSFLQQHGVKLGFMSFFLKAAAEALQQFPLINSQIDGEEIVTPDTCDIGIAVSTDRGLIVPVIRLCQEKSLASLEKEVFAYATKAREGKISPDDLQGGTFTITNGGVFGSLLSTPILNPPQSAILGMHVIQRRPVAIGEEVVIRPMMYLALSYDHRIVDGREAIFFLLHIKKALEDPKSLF